MPFNVKQGLIADFAVAFTDASGNIATPPAATLTITYTAVSGSTAKAVISMTPYGKEFTATWYSSAATIGQALITVSSPSGVASIPDPVLRITAGA